MRSMLYLILATFGPWGCIEDTLPTNEFESPPLDSQVADSLLSDSQIADSLPSDSQISDSMLPDSLLPDLGPDQAIPPEDPNNECPVATFEEQGVVEVIPRDLIVLDGSMSTDPDGPDGRPVQYIWTVTQAPAGSLATPVERFLDRRRHRESGQPDDVTTPEVMFMPELVGRYTLALSVVDAAGLTAPSAACPQSAAEVHIEARHGPGVAIEAVWNTPSDDDQTDDNGADVDLHLRHPLARAWAVAPLDCYYANPTPDWGPTGRDGDPEMLLEDPNGTGPEIVILSAPEETTTNAGYRIGHHYYRADNYNGGEPWGPSEVTTRIYLDGELAGEWIGVLEETSNFWEVAQIIWTADDRRVIAVDRHFAQMPEE